MAGNMIKVINGNSEWKKYWDNKGNFRMFDQALSKMEIYLFMEDLMM